MKNIQNGICIERFIQHGKCRMGNMPPPSFSEVAILGFYSKKLRNALKPMQKLIRFLVFEIGLKILRIFTKKSPKIAKINVVIEDAQCSESYAETIFRFLRL